MINKRRLVAARRRLNERSDAGSGLPKNLLNVYYDKLSGRGFKDYGEPMKLLPDDHFDGDERYGIRWEKEDGSYAEIFFTEADPYNIRYVVTEPNGVIKAEGENYKSVHVAFAQIGIAIESNFDDDDDDDVYDALEAIEEMGEIDLLSEWNEFCESCAWPNRIHQSYEFDEVLENYTPTEVAEMVMQSRNFSLRDSYFTISDGGQLESFTSRSDLLDQIDVDELARYLEEKH